MNSNGESGQELSSDETSKQYKTKRKKIIEEAIELIQNTASKNLNLINRIYELVDFEAHKEFVENQNNEGGNLNKYGGGKTKRQRRKRNRRKSSKAFTQ